METSFEKNTSSPNCVGHPHAENMKLYAEDAAVNEEPGNCGNTAILMAGVVVLIILSGIKRSNTAANPGQSTSMVLKFLNPSEMLLMMVKHTILLI